MGSEAKTVEEDSVYQRDYYKTHQGKLKEAKASRYRDDPEYRAEALRRAKEQKARAKKERARTPPASRKKGPLKPRIFDITVGGATLEILMFSGGQLGKRLGRKTQAIRMWEKKGILPEAMYRDPNTGARLYTEDQVQALIKALKQAVKNDGEQLVKTRISRTIFPGLAQEIWDQWPTGVAIS